MSTSARLSEEDASRPGEASRNDGSSNIHTSARPPEASASPPRDESHEQGLLRRLRRELAHPPFHALLNPVAVSVDAETGIVVIRLPYSPTLGRAADSPNVHGGAIAALIDMAAHAAIAVQTGRMAPTVDLRIDYLKPAPAADLYATAKVLRLGRAIARADIEIADGIGAAPCAVGRGTFSTLETGPAASRAT